jgi:hypothetical protein
MTERNFKKELSHSVYYDMENGNDTETIDYPSLIHIITELCHRIEQLEKVNKEKLSLLNVIEKIEKGQ